MIIINCGMNKKIRAGSRIKLIFNCNLGSIFYKNSHFWSEFFSAILISLFLIIYNFEPWFYYAI